MADFPEKPLSGTPLEETRAALASTLEATAAILPWVAKPQPVRFPPELNKRWMASCTDLARLWSERHTQGQHAVRPAIFSLLGIALETGDIDCLRLSEALASAADQLEAGPASARLIAALTATSEALLEPNGLENSGFTSRAQHFAQRLDNSLLPSNKPGQRSDVLDNLFIGDTEERLERMREALIVLPIDVYALQLESREMIHQAQEIELYGMVHLGRQLADYVLQLHEAGEEVQERARHEISVLLDTLEKTLAAVNL